MGIIKVILTIADTCMLLCMAYYAITVIFLLFKKKHIKRYEKTCKFAILIPARNEESVIKSLIESLKKQNYSKDLYDIFVIPNNCSDNTEEVAKGAGAKIINCDEKVNTKGEALKYTFNYLKEYDYNAYVIFDADNIVDQEFLNYANDIILEGYNVAQGYRESKNPYDSWVSNCYSLHYCIQNTFLNQTRVNANWSSFINGTGVVITKKYIDEYGYFPKTVTEDIELTAQCAINNEKIAFIKEAITYDEQVTTLKQSIKQRLRWSIGTMQCLVKYIKSLIKTKSMVSLDTILFLLSPLIQVIGSINFMAHLILNSGYIVNMFIFYLASILISIISLKIANKNVLKNLKAILLYPIFLLTWLPLNAIALFKRKYKWQQIKHTKVVSIDKLMEVCTK